MTLRGHTFPCGLLALLLCLATTPLASQATTPLISGDSALRLRGGTILWVFNPGNDTVRVDSLFLSNCENVNKRCAAMAIDSLIPPHQGRRLLQLGPRFPNEPYNYRWTYSWRVVAREE